MPEAQTARNVRPARSVAGPPGPGRPVHPPGAATPPFHAVHSTGDRVEALLDELRGRPDPTTRATAEELVKALIELYGGGLERILQIVIETDAAEVLHGLTTDDLVAGLLILHDLHPLTTDERVREALDEIRPHLGAHQGGVELLGVTADGVVRLRMEGGRRGCPSSRRTVTDAIERAIAEAAPEVSRVEVESPPADAPLLQIGRRPPEPCPVREGAAK
jgi:Fe-S cluster biogenesis protein NfuA